MPLMGSPVICNVGGEKPGSSAAVSSGPAVACFGGRLPMFVVLLINDARELFLPSRLSNILFPGSRAAHSFPCWFADLLLSLRFVGGESTLSGASFLRLFAWMTMATKHIYRSCFGFIKYTRQGIDVPLKPNMAFLCCFVMIVGHLRYFFTCICSSYCVCSLWVVVVMRHAS
jgi:hypothetical protein